MKPLTSFMPLAVLLLTPTSYAADVTGAAANKAIVVKFYTAAFIDRDLEAAGRYLRDDYIQHNPAVKDGSQAFLEFAATLKARNPEARYDIKRVIAEGDLVVLHIHFKAQPDAAGTAIVDIFRVANGKVAEHWDVKQAVPDTVSVNGHGFF